MPCTWANMAHSELPGLSANSFEVGYVYYSFAKASC